MQLPIELSHPCYHDEDAARVQLESIRWPDGPYCPICGSFDRVKPYGGKAMGPGWYWCTPCRRKFTVRVGSIFERSHIPLHKWLLGFRLMAGSKKGFSAHQMHRTLKVDYKTAWFMEHRIRECMDESATASPLGGEESTSRRTKPGSAAGPKTAPIGLLLQSRQCSRSWNATARRGRSISRMSRLRLSGR